MFSRSAILFEITNQIAFVSVGILFNCCLFHFSIGTSLSDVSLYWFVVVAAAAAAVVAVVVVVVALIENYYSIKVGAEIDMNFGRICECVWRPYDTNSSRTCVTVNGSERALSLVLMGRESDSRQSKTIQLCLRCARRINEYT